MAWIRQKAESEAPVQPSRDESPKQTTAPRREESRMSNVNIGKTVTITGEVSGNEDLVVEGQINGKVILKDHQLTVGANGRLKAEVTAKAIEVVGEVVGNIVASDKVHVAATGSMQGDICAPRVVLADGARFKGSIDMEPRSQASAKQKPQQQSSQQQKPAGNTPAGMSQTASPSK